MKRNSRILAFLLGSLLLFALFCGCSGPAKKSILGNWKLTSQVIFDEDGAEDQRDYIDRSDLRMIFQSDGTCVVTEDGKEIRTMAYQFEGDQITMQNGSDTLKGTAEIEGDVLTIDLTLGSERMLMRLRRAG